MLHQIPANRCSILSPSHISWSYLQLSRNVGSVSYFLRWILYGFPTYIADLFQTELTLMLPVSILTLHKQSITNKVSSAWTPIHFPKTQLVRSLPCWQISVSSFITCIKLFCSKEHYLTMSGQFWSSGSVSKNKQANTVVIKPFLRANTTHTKICQTVT